MVLRQPNGIKAQLLTKRDLLSQIFEQLGMTNFMFQLTSWGVKPNFITAHFY